MKEIFTKIFRWVSGNGSGDQAGCGDDGGHIIFSECGCIDSYSREERRLFQRQMEGESHPGEEPRLPGGEIEKAADKVHSAVFEVRERDRRMREAAERARKERVSRDDHVRFSIATDNITSIFDRVERQKTFGRMLMRYVNERCNGRASDCYRRAGLSRQLYSRIISDPGKGVVKRTALQLCIGLKLNRQESDSFLSFAGYSLSPASFEDMTFAWCFENRVHNIFDVNEILVLGGCAPLQIG